MTATTSPLLGPIHALLAEKGYEVSEPAPDTLTIREVESGVTARAVLQGDILFLSLVCTVAPKAAITPEIMASMLAADNGISTSYFQLYDAGDGKLAVTLNNFCKLEDGGPDDEDEVLSCVHFLLVDVMTARVIKLEIRSGNAVIGGQHAGHDFRRDGRLGAHRAYQRKEQDVALEHRPRGDSAFDLPDGQCIWRWLGDFVTFLRQKRVDGARSGLVVAVIRSRKYYAGAPAKAVGTKRAQPIVRQEVGRSPPCRLSSVRARASTTDHENRWSVLSGLSSPRVRGRRAFS